MNEKDTRDVLNKELLSEDELEEIQAEIHTLPIGYISRKVISGKEYFYRQWAENGKTKSQYIKKRDLDTVRDQIARRKELQSILKKAMSNQNKSFAQVQKMPEFETNVLSGRLLVQLAECAADSIRSSAAKELAAYLEDTVEKRVCLLLGLRRTGKTMMIYQSICDSRPENREKTAYIRMTAADGRKELLRDVKKLAEKGFCYLFIDEVPLWDEFAATVELLSDIYGKMGMKIVISAMNAAGAVKVIKANLFDKVIAIHTMLLSFGEYNQIFGRTSLDDFLLCGGMMQTGAVWGEDVAIPLREEQFVEAYIDNVICQDMGQDKSDNIKEVIYNLNEEIIISIFSHDFKMYDWQGVAKKLRGGMVFDDEETQEAIRYLTELDLYVPYTTIRLKTGERLEEKGVFALPWIRSSQVKTLLDAFMSDHYFANLSERDKQLIRDRMFEEAKERMLADIILHEVILMAAGRNGRRIRDGKKVCCGKSACHGKKVCRLYMENCLDEKAFLTYDAKAAECWLYTVRYRDDTDTPVPAWMTEDAMRHLIEERFGRIIESGILYLGEEQWTENGIHYQNAEEFLCS